MEFAINVLDAAGDLNHYEYNDLEPSTENTGEKLRTIHYTAAPDISVPYGQTYELVAGEIGDDGTLDETMAENYLKL